MTESAGSYVESCGSGTSIDELPSKGLSSSSSSSKRGLLHGLFIGVEVRNGCDAVKAVEVPTPKSVQDTVFCVPLIHKNR